MGIDSEKVVNPTHAALSVNWKTTKGIAMF